MPTDAVIFASKIALLFTERTLRQANSRSVIVAESGLAPETSFQLVEEKLSKLRDKEVKTLIFDKYLRETNNAKEGNQSVKNFFGKK